MDIEKTSVAVFLPYFFLACKIQNDHNTSILESVIGLAELAVINCPSSGQYFYFEWVTITTWISRVLG